MTDEIDPEAEALAQYESGRPDDPEAWISLALPGRLLRSLRCSGKGPRTSVVPWLPGWD